MSHVRHGDARGMRSTKGFFSVALMLEMCETVDVYGFKDELPWQSYHYWDASPDVASSRWGASNIHNVQLEHLILDAWNTSSSTDA
eukprot:976532-Prymnesium_polylepis.1